jgi:antirestriction protein
LATGDEDADIDEANDAFYGQYDSILDLAYEYVESTGMLANVDETISRYFDYERFAHDLSFDFSEANGFYFNNY